MSDPNIKSVAFSGERGTPSLIVMNNKAAGYSPSQAATVLSTIVGTRAGIDNIVAQREVAVNKDLEVQEFRQYFKGLKVEHARFSALNKQGKLQLLSGAFFDIPAALSTQPKLSEAQALSFAKNHVNASVYAWEELQNLIGKTTDVSIQQKLQQELNEYLPKGELVVVKDFREHQTAEMRLAYKFNIYAFQPLSREWVYVDAVNGDILLMDKIIKHVDEDKPGKPLPLSVATQAQTRYAGLRHIYVQQISGTDPNTGETLVASNPTENYTPGAATYVLMDDTRGDGIETYDLNAIGGLPISVAITYSLGKSFTDVDNNWTLAEHQRGNTVPTAPVEAENDDIAWDAHWGAGVVYDYWKEKHNRLSFDGNNAKIKSFIHSGLAFDNAFWNGSVMTYGDGSYPAPGGFRPLTSLDVCGHEIGHGICSYTSDLVYASESGAMNEGLSDIWAACIEHFANQRFGTGYKPFYIGEQIAEDPSVPLRRMDNPQARTDPDTYGGSYFSDPNCTPNILNDECGVHTNSGILNKWFYLLTVGSGAGSGPDASYAGEDDGVNDIGNVYDVTGVGFDISEQIVYLTELLLSSTATFAEAREISIQVAAEMSGNPCSDLVRSVTNAWYAVGVGNAFAPDCKISYGFVTQPGISVSESEAGNGCAAENEVRITVYMPANSSGSVTVSGTAKKDIDYRLPATTLANSSSAPAVIYLSVYVKNDGEVETDETLDFTLSLDAGNNTVNKNFRLNIVEDDVLPLLGTNAKNLLSADFNSIADGFKLPTGWSEIIGKEGALAVGENLNHWGVWNGKLMVTGKTDNTGLVILPAGTYNDNSPTTTIVRTSLLDARGLSNLDIAFSFRVQGEVDPNGADIEAWGIFDYMAVVYSFDGNTFYELTQHDGFGAFASLAAKDGQVQGKLPSFLNNKTFYLGFKWFNDTNAGGPESVQVDNVQVSGIARKMENDAGNGGSERVEAGQMVYLYSVQDGELITAVNNTSAKSFGCTQAEVSQSGNGSFVLDLGSAGKVTAAEKAIRLQTEIANKVTTTIALYFTEAQLQALEAATGVGRTNFTVYQINATDISSATGRNTTKLTATYNNIAGVGGSYNATVGNNLGSYYVLGYAASATGGGKGGGKNRKMEAGNEQPLTWKFSAVYPNPAASQAYVDITAPQATKLRVEYLSVNGQLLHVQQQSIAAGTNRLSLNVQAFSRGAYLVRFRDEKGTMLETKPLLRQ
ncbi:MAG: M4 family metallopeptidase [Flavisolibacter sp.]